MVRPVAAEVVRDAGAALGGATGPVWATLPPGPLLRMTGGSRAAPPPARAWRMNSGVANAFVDFDLSSSSPLHARVIRAKKEAITTMLRWRITRVPLARRLAVAKRPICYRTIKGPLQLSDQLLTN